MPRRMKPRMQIQLVPPDDQYRASFLRGLDEFRKEGLPWWLGEDLETAEQDFPAFVANKLADSNRATETLVSKTHRWAVAEGQFVGRISIHHELTDALRVEGGHIGYDTVPSFRGRGVASEMLRQALPLARTLGLTELLITCDDSNSASIRVIERNGGSLRETKALHANHPAKRYYWIPLP
jgi:predicted acetyltransferase